MFWIVIYCMHMNRCYVSQDIPGGPHKYATAEECNLAIHPPVPELQKDGKTWRFAGKGGAMSAAFASEKLAAEASVASIPIKEIHKNSQCINVHAVDCYNGGSACTFTPVDLGGIEALKNMVQPPK